MDVLQSSTVRCRDSFATFDRALSGTASPHRPGRDALVALCRYLAIAACFLVAIVGRAVAEPAWIDVPAIKQVDVSRLGAVLADIESRLPNGHPYVNQSNFVNWAHEGTHGVNSHIRNGMGGARHNGFYCLDGRGIVLREPNLSISRHIAPLVPQELRGQLLGPGWDDTPLYVIDEWVAYTNGTAAGLDCAERGIPFSQPGEVDAFTVGQMLRGCGYATALLIAVERFDPDYSDRDALEEFIGWNIGRCLALAEKALSLRQFTDQRNVAVEQALFASFMEGAG